MNIPKYLIVHHTGGSDANPLQDSSSFTFDQCNQLHKLKFNMVSSLGYYVGYHYYISKDGEVKQARSDSDEGAHTIGHNSESLGICLAGNFDATDPTPDQVESLKTLLKKKMVENSIPLVNIIPHRHFAVKTCYGNRLADNWAALLVSESNKEQQIAKALSLVREAADVLKEII